MADRENALLIENLSKSFRVARGRGGSDDPRRERLSRRHDRFWALREAGFKVAKGETIGLIGPNGSGKSTLLKIMAGVMRPGSGRFEAHGRVGALLELGAGFHPDLSGIENVYLNGALLGLSPRQVDRFLPQIIAFAELERFMDMPVRHYSSGMTARLGFAIATQLAPDILLMDETFAAGDARFQAKALDHVTMMKSRGHTMILVSHNMEMILTLADRVVWLDRGRVHRDGPTRPVLAEYRQSGRHNLYAADRMRAALGMESLFESVDPSRAVARIEEVELSTDSLTSAGPAQSPIDVESHQTLWLELAIAHGADHPARIYIETAWVRGEDEKIIAQSRTEATLHPGAGLTRMRLAFGPWNLTPALLRLAVAISPIPPAENEPSAPAYRHYDRRLNAGAIRLITPTPIELPVATAIPLHWKLSGSA